MSHIPHCWKSHVVAHIWTSLLLFREMLRPAITDLFCFGAKSTGVDLYSQTIFSHYIFKESLNLHVLCLCAFFDVKTKKNEIIKTVWSTGIRTHNLRIWSYSD